MNSKYIYSNIYIKDIPIKEFSYSDPNDFNSSYIKFLYRNSFKDIFSSNHNNYLILLQNIIQNVITKLHYLDRSNNENYKNN